MSVVVAAAVYGVGQFTDSLVDRQDEARAASSAERDDLVALVFEALGEQLSADVAAGVLPSAPVSWRCAAPTAESYTEADRMVDLNCTADLTGVDGPVTLAYRGQVDTATGIATAVRAPDLDPAAP